MPGCPGVSRICLLSPVSKPRKLVWSDYGRNPNPPPAHPMNRLSLRLRRNVSGYRLLAVGTLAGVLALLPFSGISAETEKAESEPESRSTPEPRAETAPAREQAHAHAALTAEGRARYLHIAGDMLEAGGFLRDSRELHRRADELAATDAASRRSDRDRDSGRDTAQPPTRRPAPATAQPPERQQAETKSLRKDVAEQIDDRDRRIDAETGEVHQLIEQELERLARQVDELQEMLAEVSEELNAQPAPEKEHNKPESKKKSAR